MSQRPVPLVGLIGGIGSGKSSVADAVAGLLRGTRLDADATGHRALQQPAIRRRLREAFGSEVFDAAGQVIRSQLARKVFGNDAAAAEHRATLNSIVHPWIRAQHLAEIERLTHDPDCHVILLDAAVLLESGWGNFCDAIAFVDVPLVMRLQRVASRGWDAAELARREASQLTLDEKRHRADIVIDNSRTVQAAAEDLAVFLKKRFELSDSPATSTPTKMLTT